VLGATIVNRWFTTNRGLDHGAADRQSTATGLLDLHAAARGAGRNGAAGSPWRSTVAIVHGGARSRWSMLLVPERPSSIGLRSLRQHAGRAGAGTAGSRATSVDRTRSAICCARPRRRGRSGILFATFFICGFTTNGLVGTHLIAFCGDHGIVGGAGGEPARR
jgi:hypothetical protein